MNDHIEARRVVLGYRDHDRQEYADRAPIPDAGEFNISCLYEDGSQAPGGEFRVTLMEVRHRLLPHVEAFGDGTGCLRASIDLGLLEELAPVGGHVEFSQRLTRIGMADLSDREIGESSE